MFKISDEAYKDFECSLSRDKHFLKEPVLLKNCRHVACKNCLLDRGGNFKAQITCNCGIITKSDFKTDPIIKPFENVINKNLEQLLDVIEKQTSEALDSFKCKFIKFQMENCLLFCFNS